MVIRTPRNGDEERIVSAFRAAFDASVMNFGSYNLLYARNMRHSDTPAPAQSRHSAEISVQDHAAGSAHLLVGYRREPLEMVLCPVELEHALDHAAGRVDSAPAPSAPALVNLTNLAGMSTSESSVEVVFSTGRRITLSILPSVTFDRLPETPLHQPLDVEDFYDFLDHFMDRVDGVEP